MIELARFIPFYSFASLVSLLGFGALIDRFSGRQVMAVVLIPAAIGLIVLAKIETLELSALAFLLIGISQGAGGALSGVLWVEFYGSNHHGEIRALSHGLMVFACAIGPFLSGYALKIGIGYSAILIVLATLCIMAAMLYMIAARRSKARFDSFSNLI